jgi:hypothetical protein
VDPLDDGKRRVRFAAPLVTKIKHRPYTEPEEIAELFFVSKELDEYERDRETVEGDQFECSLALHHPKRRHSPLAVTVQYKSRRNRDELDQHDDLMLSPSDLSALAEYDSSDCEEA